jgi:hypothetical protein
MLQEVPTPGHREEAASVQGPFFCCCVASEAGNKKMAPKTQMDPNLNGTNVFKVLITDL